MHGARRLVLLLVAVAAIGRGAPAALAAPQPSVAPASWTLDFTYDDPQRIIVGGRVYWYMLYTVANNTGMDVDFYPRFELMYGDTHVIRSGVGVPSSVFAAIKQRHAKTRPFLLSPTEIIGELRQSNGYARDGVAIWPQFDTTVNRFTIFVTGLSGEIAEVPNANYDRARPETKEIPLNDGTTVPEVVNPKFFTLHKTLAISYQVPGDATSRIDAPAVRRSQEWIMR